MSIGKWFYRGGRPNRVARVVDRLTALVYAQGVARDYLVALEVPGRRSGRMVVLPLVMVVVSGERYLVSMLGEGSNWVQNVRKADGRARLLHGRRDEVLLEDVATGLRAPILKEYLRRAPNARVHVPIDEGASLHEFERIAGRYPVFRVAPDVGADSR